MNFVRLNPWRQVAKAATRITHSTHHIVPRGHLLAIIVLSLLLLVSTMLVPTGEVAASRQQTIKLQFPEPPRLFESGDEGAFAEEAADVPPAPVAVEEQKPASASLNWKQEIIKPGDNLTSLFRRLSLSASDVYAVANATEQAAALKLLRPDESVWAGLDSSGQLVQMRYERSLLESYVYERRESGFVGKKIIRQPDLLPAFRAATIENSLFLDGEQAGLSHNVIMQIASIFGWDIDFALDIRKGDSFAILFEEKFLDGAKIASGDILAAEFRNQGEVFRAVRYVDPDGSINYYTPDGQPMRKAFLRAPLDFTRISSNFNLRRQHPIHKMVKAHRGVDYAAPTGTPIYAAGDGKVIASGYSKANGNYVFIQHGQKYTTKYLHLNKRAVRSGQSVKQQQVIGTVGSTGYATGPHLHYEFLVNGVHHNPRTVELPKADPISTSARQAFIAQTGPLVAQLANLNTLQFAQAGSN